MAAADELYIEPAGDDDYEDEYDDSSSSPSSKVNTNKDWPQNPADHFSSSSYSSDSSSYLFFNGTGVPTTTQDFDLDPINKPYIHLNGLLPNLTRNEGDQLRLKCNVAGTLPIEFKWYKNDAPLLKDRNRIVVKNRDYWSRLTVKTLEPLDQAYYRCEGNNKAGKVSTTSLIQVRPNKNRRIGADLGPSHRGGPPHRGRNGDLREEEDQDDPASFLKPHTCQEYPFEACKDYLAGEKIYIHSTNIEEIRDIDRRLHAAFIVINNSSQVSKECKMYAARAACYHSYRICDNSPSPRLAITSISGNPRHSVSSSAAAASAKGSVPIRRICKKDCEDLENEICTQEYKNARSQNLIGDGSEHILPDCQLLPDDEEKCLHVVSDFPETSGMYCYQGNGEKYRGQISITKSNGRCQKWVDAGKKHPYVSPAKFSELRFHNYCRNPGGAKAQPWCFNSDGVEEYCDVPKCPPGSYGNKGGDADDDGTSADSGIMGIPSEYSQYALLAASILGVLFIVMLAGMACYCVHRSRQKRSMKGKKPNGTAGPPPQSTASPTSTSLLPVGVMNGYPHHPHQREYFSSSGMIGNGIRKPIPNGQQMEMSSLLPQSGYMPAALPPPPPSSSLLDSIPDIPSANIRYMEELGQGQFGKVWRAELVGYPAGAFSVLSSEDGAPDENEPLQVAVKTLKDDASARMRQDFEHEVAIMARLKHPNIVQLLGVSCVRNGQTSSAASSNGPTSPVNSARPGMVFEYMMHGNLNELLLLRSPYSQPETVDTERILLDHSDFLHIASQIAAGMDYLASQHYVHRDLATRNCLVADRLTIKISDFGLMRDIYASDYYRQQSNTFLPIRWMPPESITYGRYSEASDVWAYGVTLWEIYSYGTQPYYGYSNPEVIEMVRQRCLLACPENCPPRMYSLMVECWHESPTRRPRFAEIHARLQTWSVVSSPSHSSAAHAIGVGPIGPQNNRKTPVGRVASSSAHSDRSAGNSSGASSSCRTRSNGGMIGSAGQIMPAFS